MLKILINAYACSPDMGSEPGMAWNWCVHLAKHCELHIITEGEFRDKIEAALPTLPQAENMHFYHNPVSDEVRQMCWNQGDWRFYKHYKKWQYKTYEMVLDIVKQQKIDIVHQLNMIGFREPGYLWKIEKIPFVWGPVDAKDSFPVAYLEGATVKTKLFVYLKNFLTGIQLRFSSRVRKAVKQASVVVSASSNSQNTFRRYFKIESPLLNETGTKILSHYNAYSNKAESEILKVLWVGKLDFRKQLGLAIRSVAKTNNNLIQLHIVGGGNDTDYKNLAAHLNISNQCTFYGIINHQEVQGLMADSDLLFFTSVAEGTPHVVLEAVSNFLPVLCFDTCGQGDSINEKVGRKVKLSSPSQSVEDFARELNDLFHHHEVLKVMSENCKQRQLELSWDKKAEKMVGLYNGIIKNR